MIYKKKIIAVVIATLVLVMLTLAGFSFYSDNVTYSCTGQQKIYIKFDEYIDVWIKMNVKDHKSTMLVKGVYHNADGSRSNIYRQGNYQYKHFGKGRINVKLLSVQQLFKDSSPERLSNYIFGIEPGESRYFRYQEIRDGLMMFGSEYAWFYTCKIDA